MPDRTCDASALKAGDKLYEVSYYTVESVDDEYVRAKCSKSGRIKIHKNIVSTAIFSTDQYAREERLTRTQLAQKLETLGHAAFRVTFRKQVTSNDVADGLEDADVGSKSKRRKLVKSLMEGERRVMHARLLRSEEFDAAMELGRFKVIDLDALEKADGDEKRATRLVDTRTIEELVVDNVKYFV